MIRTAALLLLAALTGCGTITQAHLHHMSNQELSLRRYQLMRSTNRIAWGTAYSDLKDDTEELQDIEKEMLRRGMIIQSGRPQYISPNDIRYGNPQPQYQ